MSNWMAVLRVSERTRMLDQSSAVVDLVGASLESVVEFFEGRKPRPRKILRHNLVRDASNAAKDKGTVGVQGQ